MNIKHFLLALILLVSVNSQAQKQLFDHFSKMDGVTTVYISKAMLQMMPDMQVQEGMDLSNFAGKLDGLLILTSEQESITKMMRNETAHFADNSAYEVLMKVRDEESKVDFFIRKKPDQRIAELVMLVDDDGEFVIIQMTGNMTMDDIKQLTKGMNKH
jgi:hypothetical protein